MAIDIHAALDAATKKAGLGDVEIAFKVGVSQKAVARWRSGEKSPRALHLAKLLEVVPGFWERLKPTKAKAA